MTRTIEVFDTRAYIPGNPRQIATHANVPQELTVREVLQRYGIGQHLTVYQTDEEGRRVVHQGVN